MLCHTARRLRYFATTMHIARRLDPVDFRALVGGQYGEHACLYRLVRSGQAEAAATEWAHHVHNAMRTFLRMHSEDMPAGVLREAIRQA